MWSQAALGEGVDSSILKLKQNHDLKNSEGVLAKMLCIKSLKTNNIEINRVPMNSKSFDSTTEARKAASFYLNLPWT